jgi:hypothetical protein
VSSARAYVRAVDSTRVVSREGVAVKATAAALHAAAAFHAVHQAQPPDPMDNTSPRAGVCVCVCVSLRIFSYRASARACQIGAAATSDVGWRVKKAIYTAHLQASTWVCVLPLSLSPDG